MTIKKNKIVIFTDLDGSVLHRDTFKFDQIKDYIKKLINSGIHIIPNSSKTESEIIEFNQDLGENLAYISILIGLIGGFILFPSPDFSKSLLVGVFIPIDLFPSFVTQSLLFLSFVIATFLPLLIIKAKKLHIS